MAELNWNRHPVGYGYRIARRHVQRRWRVSGGSSRTTPDLAPSFQDVPNFLDGPVPYGAGDLSRRQRDLNQAGAGCAVTVVDEQANLRAIGSDGVGLNPPATQRRGWLVAYHGGPPRGYPGGMIAANRLVAETDP